MNSLSRLRRWSGGDFAPYLFIAPFFIIFISFGLFPFLYAFRLSFTDWRGIGEPVFVGLSNYVFLLRDSLFWESIGNSLYLWLLIVPTQTIFSVLVAYLLVMPSTRFRMFFRTTFLMSYLVPIVAIAQIWKILFDQDFGGINFILKEIGLPAIGWLTTTTWAKPTLALLVFWKSSGFAILIMLSAIQGIPMELFEAAELDGASGIKKFLYITLPLMRRAIGFYVVIATLAVVQMFAEPYVLTQGGPYRSTTTAGYLLNQYMKYLDYGTGAANSFILTIIVLVLSLLLLRFLRTGEED